MARDIPIDLTTATGVVDRGATHRRNIGVVGNAVLVAIVTRAPATTEGLAEGPAGDQRSSRGACTDT